MLVVIFDNRRLGRGRPGDPRALYPRRPRGAGQTALPLTSLEPSPDYAAIAGPAGLWGGTVHDPAALDRALGEALAAVRGEGRSAVLDIRLDG